jgi:Membrane transport protein MerF
VASAALPSDGSKSIAGDHESSAFAVSMLGCVTSALVALLAALGESGSGGWLDYILLPAMALFAGLTAYAIICRLCGRRISN